MADLLNIGLSALISQQRALTTTSNNIANANTPGYTRQRVELVQRQAQRIGSDFLGTGVDIATVRRLSDELLAGQLRSASGSFNRADAFVSLAESLDNMLADFRHRLDGHHAVVREFAAERRERSVVDLEPPGAVGRSEQSGLSVQDHGPAAHRAQRRSSHAAHGDHRQRHHDRQTARRHQQAAHRSRFCVGQERAFGFARQARPIARAAAGLVQVSTAQQRDGTTSVFIGSGQVLVLGSDSATVKVTPGQRRSLCSRRSCSPGSAVTST